jgi:MFS superfamily sulfate permease-like transporter
MLPLLAYFLFGSSRQIVVGPDSAMAAIVAVAVVPLAMGGPARLAMLCATLGVMVGVLCIAAGLLRQRAISRCQRWQKGSRVSRETTKVIDKH